MNFHETFNTQPIVNFIVKFVSVYTNKTVTETETFNTQYLCITQICVIIINNIIISYQRSLVNNHPCAAEVKEKIATIFSGSARLVICHANYVLQTQSARNAIKDTILIN